MTEGYPYSDDIEITMDIQSILLRAVNAVTEYLDWEADTYVGQVPVEHWAVVALSSAMFCVTDPNAINQPFEKAFAQHLLDKYPALDWDDRVNFDEDDERAKVQVTQ